MALKVCKKKTSVLIVGQVPPPFHGQAVMIKVLVDAEFDRIDKTFIPMKFSNSMSEVGEFKLKKVFHLISLVFLTVSYLLKNRDSMLVYYPAPPKLIPIVRDILYLIVVRPLARKTIFIYHAAGSGSFLRSANIFLKLLANIAYRKPNAAVMVSESAPQDASQFSPQQTFVVRNGIHVPILAEPKMAGYTRPMLLFVGLHSREKGVLCCLQTIKILVDLGQDIGIKFVGEWVDKEFESECLHFVEQNRLAQNVEFLGRLVGDEKWQAFLACDFFIFPSSHHAESFGLVVVEAFAYGLPVIACRWRGISDIIDDKINGFLIDGQNPDEYAARILELINSCDMRQSFSSAARCKYLNCYTEKIHLDSMTKMFVEVWNAES
jgi:glycosyltransferase involved in cell wall biosynthesis